MTGQALAEDKIVSEKELLQARNQYENAKSVYDNLSKILMLPDSRNKSYDRFHQAAVCKKRTIC